MSAIEVQLDAYVIPDDHHVFKFSPGKTYRFYNIVREAKTAFLDIRGLDALPDDPAKWDDQEVLKIIADDRWAREQQSRARGNKPNGQAGVRRIDRRNLTFLKELIFDAKKGDLVIVPVEGYRKDVLIGEFLTDPGDVRDVTAKDGEETHIYVGRAVRWIAAVEKRLFSSEMLTRLHSPTAIFVLGKSLRHEVYRHSYGNFIFDGDFVASFHTSKDKFTAEDSAVVSTWFNGFDFLRHADGALPDTFFEMGLGEIPDDDAAELNINVNSPGTFLLKSKDAFALSLMAFLALSGCDATSVTNDGVTVHLKRVGGASADCEHDIEASVNGMAKALGPKRLEQACKLGVRAQKDATLSAAARLKLGAKKRT